MEKSKSRKLTKKEFEAKQNLVGFFRLLLEIDIRNNPQFYENNRDTDNTNQTPKRFSGLCERSFK
jgi:hypothetical protein